MLSSDANIIYELINFLYPVVSSHTPLTLLLGSLFSFVDLFVCSRANSIVFIMVLTLV